MSAHTGSAPHNPLSNLNLYFIKRPSTITNSENAVIVVCAVSVTVVRIKNDWFLDMNKERRRVKNTDGFDQCVIQFVWVNNG
jgi:hypothetical protein